MSVGQFVRRVLGPNAFAPLGRAYRRIFVDLDKVVQTFPPLSEKRLLLDVGGGDGEVINALVRHGPPQRIVMIDPAEELGRGLTPESLERTVVLPSTSVRDYLDAGHEVPDVVMISDVFHHIPVDRRESVLADLGALIRGQEVTLLVKDIDPQGVRARAALMSDLYVTGDKNVVLIPRDEMREMLSRTLHPVSIEETTLFGVDRPNYGFVVTTQPVR
jgi:2-polyprenyl-3-methyl-5-hydroxy-6-metoxy-1,4-benzoquinol methylase